MRERERAARRRLIILGLLSCPASSIVRTKLSQELCNQELTAGGETGSGWRWLRDLFIFNIFNGTELTSPSPPPPLPPPAHKRSAAEFLGIVLLRVLTVVDLSNCLINVCQD